MSNKVKIEEILIQTGLEIARKGEGALFIISDSSKYQRLGMPSMKPFSIYSKGARKLLFSFGIIDGAVIVTTKGIVKAYDVMVKVNKVYNGYGTRHSAAISASLDKETSSVILVSEEERKVKIFKHGKLVMQLDALEKKVDTHVSEAVNIIESIGIGTISTIGVSVLAPTVGITLIPGIIIFGGSYAVIKALVESLRKLKMKS